MDEFGISYNLMQDWMENQNNQDMAQRVCVREWGFISLNCSSYRIVCIS